MSNAYSVRSQCGALALDEQRLVVGVRVAVGRAVAQDREDGSGERDQRSIDSTLALVCSGRVPRECGVQNALIEVLCDYGADPTGALLPALVHGEWGAVDGLICRGARGDLIVAAATGRLEEARQTLSVANRDQRQLALGSGGTVWTH